jgi:methionyl-tRNA formyltransferase
MRLYLCGQKAFGKAVFEMCLQEKHDIVGVSAPLCSERDPGRPDRLCAAAEDAGVKVLPSGMLNADTLPSGVDLILAAHSHDFVGRKTRNKAVLGGIGYHPSLLPLHRGRDAVRWAVKMGDRITGGTIYWLSDNIDSGDMASQDYCLIESGETPEDLWRDKLFPLGVELFRRALRDISAGRIIAVPQAEACATWEPSWERPPLRRPDLLMIGAAEAYGAHQVYRDSSALHR